MTKALTAKEADQVVSRAKRKAAREEAALNAREQAALAELDSLGVNVNVHEPRHWDEGDPLMGLEPGWKTGTCYAIAFATDGRRKSFSGVSAVQVLDDAKRFIARQEALKPDAPGRFEIAKDEDEISVPQVFHRPGSEQIARDRRRKIISFQAGFAAEVDAHGDPIGDTTSSVSQHRDS